MSLVLISPRSEQQYQAARGNLREVEEGQHKLPETPQQTAESAAAQQQMSTQRPPQRTGANEAIREEEFELAHRRQLSPEPPSEGHELRFAFQRPRERGMDGDE